MKPTILASRAICTVYAEQIIKPFLYIALGIFVCVLAIIVLLTAQVSGWWALLFLPAVPIAVGIVAASFIVRSVLRLIAPDMTTEQQRAASAYVETFNEVTGHAGTPKIFIIVRILFDIISRRWKDGFIQRVTSQSVRLKTDFQALSKSFE